MTTADEMQQSRSHNRAPGSFSPLTSTNASILPGARPPPIKTTSVSRASFSSDEATIPTPTFTRPRSRNPSSANPSPGLSPGSFSAHTSPSVYQSSVFAGSNSSLVNNQRAHPSSPAAAAAIATRAGLSTTGGGGGSGGGTNSSSPLASTSSILSSSSSKAHRRNHSQSQGHFEPTLPSTSTNNLYQHQQAESPQAQHYQANFNTNPTALAAATQATMQHQSQHLRQRSQTVPVPSTDNLTPSYDSSQKLRGASTSVGKGPLSPPILSLTEASAPNDNGFTNHGYHNGLAGCHTTAATTAANVVFQRPNAGGNQSSPGLPLQISAQIQLAPEREREAPLKDMAKAKQEKSSRKLFSRPGKISVKGDVKEKPQPSPGKIGAALSSLQRSNFSTTSLVDPPSLSSGSGSGAAPSLYNLTNSSTATIRAIDSPNDGGTNYAVREGKEGKEKRHHFLSRGKHKLKEAEFIPKLSSSSSNSQPTDPSAPSSMYSFNVPSSPGPATTSFKSGLDLRHGGRSRDKRREDKSSESRIDYGGDAASIYAASTHAPSEWPGPSSLPGQSSGLYLGETLDPARFGLHNMTVDDAWPYLKAKLLVIFQGEDLRLPVEDLNRAVTLHLQYCIQRRAPHIIVEDLRELLSMGFGSLDQALRASTDDKLIPDLVELWMFTFTSILPYIQAVFLPLDLEFAGNGPLLTPEQARDFWGGVIASHSPPTASSPTSERRGHAHHESSASASSNFLFTTPLANVLDVRRMVLAAYRDAVILPRYDTLRQIFSRLSLEFLPMGMALQSPPIPITGTNAPAGGGFFSGSSSFDQTQPFGISLAASEPSSSIMAGAQAGSLGSIAGSIAGAAFMAARPGTAMSLDPSVASYNSTGTTLFGAENSSNSSGLHQSGQPSSFIGPSASGGGGGGGNSSSSSGGGGGSGSITGNGGAIILPNSRNRAISNVSFGSNLSADRPFTPGGGGGYLSSTSTSLEDRSKQVTEMVGRMLQCMSVLAAGAGVGIGISSVGGGDEGSDDEDQNNRKIGELCRLLKLNWLGRGRTGRNRRGIVGGRVKRDNLNARTATHAGLAEGLEVS